MTYTVPHFINGQRIVSKGKTLPIYNPAAGEMIGQLMIADQEIVNQAVSAATSAFFTWSLTTAEYRAAILFRFKFLLDKHCNELASLITQEHGKTIKEAIGSVQRGIAVVNFTCGMPSHLLGRFAENVATDMDCYSLQQPLGVCVGITPFNFPAMIPLWMFPMAIACGNSFVLKPSEKDPSCSIRLAELAKEAGVPDGVINVIQGDKETVEALITHKKVEAISFVGSSAVAEHIHRTATSLNKRVQAFGGAKNHCVVMPDADLDKAAEAIVLSAYGSAGERCMAISAILVVGNQIADALIAKMKPIIKKLTLGPGHLDNIDIGPLITNEHRQRVKSYVDLGKLEGADLVIDGSDEKPDTAKAGFFMGCSLFDNVTPSMRIYREEIFGPVLVQLRVANIEEALQLINDHEYGNGTAIFTRDGYAARTFAEKVKVGMVGINVPIPVPVAQQSFGGWKRSNFSEIGMYGPEAIRFYTKLKTVTQRWYS